MYEVRGSLLLINSKEFTLMMTEEVGVYISTVTHGSSRLTVVSRVAKKVRRLAKKVRRLTTVSPFT